jgi:hypothetical protein
MSYREARLSPCKGWKLVSTPKSASDNVPEGNVLSSQSSKREKLSFEVVSGIPEERRWLARLPLLNLARAGDEAFASFFVRARVLPEDEDAGVGADLIGHHPLAP